jgi:hypothetical protein
VQKKEEQTLDTVGVVRDGELSAHAHEPQRIQILRTRKSELSNARKTTAAQKHEYDKSAPERRNGHYGLPKATDSSATTCRCGTHDLFDA